MKRNILFVFLSVFIIIFDQITKFAVLKNFQYAERLNIIPNFFDLTLVFNPGAAFSFLSNQNGWQKYFFLILAIVVSCYLIYAVFKKHFGLLGSIGAMMIVGGAIGNVIDRLIHGQVVDFLLFYFGNYYYPAFNVADSFICIGAGLLLLESAKKKKDK
ncbi:MAG: lipoprotein signal peptidase [Neisseriaceae bacterium]|nr:lipoprotein signal peptidase [Neisseriaceae bacterium]